MPSESSASASAEMFRIDRFAVPAEVLPAFMDRLHHIQRLLGALPGCQQNLVLTRADGAGEFNVMTVVGWANSQAVAAAKAVVQKRYEEEGFDPSSFIQKLGIKADFGMYKAA